MRIFLVSLFVASAVFAGNEVPAVSRSAVSEEKEPSVENDDVAYESSAADDKAPLSSSLEEEVGKDEKPAAKKPVAKKSIVKVVNTKKVFSVTVRSSNNKKREKKVDPIKVGCYSAIVSNIITIGFIILIVIVWYFGCIRHGRCCCMCCYNKQGRCCCACSCCDGYIAPEDEEMVISRGDKPEYDSIEKTA